MNNLRHLSKPKSSDISIEFRNRHSASSTSANNTILKWAEKIMIGVGISGQTLFYFQAYKIYTLGSANDVSGWGFTFAFISLVCWLVYGILIKNNVLIIVNAFAAIGAFLTLLAIVLVS